MKQILGLILITALIFSCKEEKNTPATSPEVVKYPAYVSKLMQQVKEYPDSLSYRLRLVEALDSMKLYPQALAHMDSVIAKDSTNNSYWFRKGQLEENVRDTIAAIESYLISIKIYPAVDAQLYLANLLAERKDDRALLIVNNVSRSMFDRRTLAECDFIAGVYHARKKNYELAHKLFDRCINNQRKFMEAYIEKGLLLMDENKTDQAMIVFHLATTVEPTYADAWYYEGKCWESLGKTEEAKQRYEESLKYDPELKEAKDALLRLGSQQS
jgi:tetratricopeptide (TPR) repeat protein